MTVFCFLLSRMHLHWARFLLEGWMRATKYELACPRESVWRRGNQGSPWSHQHESFCLYVRTIRSRGSGLTPWMESLPSLWLVKTNSEFWVLVNCTSWALFSTGLHPLWCSSPLSDYHKGLPSATEGTGRVATEKQVRWSTDIQKWCVPAQPSSEVPSFFLPFSAFEQRRPSQTGVGMNHPVFSYGKKTMSVEKVWPQSAGMNFLEDSCRWCYIRSSFSCFGLIANPEGCTWQSSRWHTFCQWMWSSVTWVHRMSDQEARRHHLPRWCRASCWVDQRYKFMLE